MSATATCCEKVLEAGRWPSYHPCGKPSKVERDGKPYCTIHDPERRKRLADERHNAWRALSEKEAKRRQIEAAAPDMLEALKALDKFWTDEFPKGPDVPAPFPNAEVRLGEDTIAIWKQIRVAIAKAKGKP